MGTTAGLFQFISMWGQDEVDKIITDFAGTI